MQHEEAYDSLSSSTTDEDECYMEDRDYLIKKVFSKPIYARHTVKSKPSQNCELVKLSMKNIHEMVKEQFFDELKLMLTWVKPTVELNMRDKVRALTEQN